MHRLRGWILPLIWLGIILALFYGCAVADYSTRVQRAVSAEVAGY